METNPSGISGNLVPSFFDANNKTENANKMYVGNNLLLPYILEPEDGNIFPGQTVLSCEKCGVSYKNQKTFNNHLKTNKHLKKTKVVEVKNYCCDTCDLKFRDKYDFEKHLLTAKHKRLFAKENETMKCEKCNIDFTTRSGLWKHKQKCLEHQENEFHEEEQEKEQEKEQEQEPEPDCPFPEKPLNNVITPELIMLLIQQNKEMQHAMIEMAKKIGNTTNSHNTTNIQNNNKSFNLNVFLNETCKDAMNMSDFLNRLDVTTYDFEETGKNGYVQGMCRILENGLNQLELHERPIHCTDAKRETIYIKDNDKWEKDDEKKTKLVSVIKQVGAKNIKMIPQWCKEHPGWNDADSKENDRYLKYVFNSMCGGTDEEIYKNYGDIARYISRITVVDKKEVIAIL